MAPGRLLCLSVSSTSFYGSPIFAHTCRQVPESGGDGIVDEVTSECFGRCASNPFLSPHLRTCCHLAAPCHKLAVNSPVGAQGSRAKRLESEEDAPRPVSRLQIDWWRRGSTPARWVEGGGAGLG